MAAPDAWDNLVIILDDGEVNLSRLGEALAGPYLVTSPELAEGAYTLIAASGGAAAALRQTLHSPDDVAALVLISPLCILPSAVDATHDPGLAGRLADIRASTLVVFGSKDRRVGPEVARVYSELIPNCHVAFVYDAGHDVMSDRPEALITLVADFVERRETFVVDNQSSVINP